MEATLAGHPEQVARRGTLLGLLERVWFVNKTISPVTVNLLLWILCPHPSGVVPRG